ncbi:hypothetical protein ALC62_07859, partial [Cyphomyrmex costatus]
RERRQGEKRNNEDNEKKIRRSERKSAKREAETAVSNYGDRCPSLGRRAKTNKRVPPVVLERLLVFLFGCLLHENSRSQAVRASSLADPNEAIRKRSSYWPSVAGGTDRLENALLRRAIDVRPKEPSIFFP